MGLVDQLDRVITRSIERCGRNGKFTGADRCRFLDIARGSALECAASLNVLRPRSVLGGRLDQGQFRLPAHDGN